MKWYSRRRGKSQVNPAKLDVRVTATIRAGLRKNTTVTFRHGCHKGVMGEDCYYIFGIDNRRVYFKPSDKENGWRLTVVHPEYAQFNTTNLDLYKWAMLNGGEFVLEHDEEGYYIEGVNDYAETESDDRS